MSKKKRRKQKQAKRNVPVHLILAGVLVFLLALGLYANTLGHRLVFDDATLIEQNPHLRDLDLWNLIGPHSYRPIRTLTYALNYWLGGFDPFGYHLFNVILHALNGVLVLGFLYSLTGRIWLALPAALLFTAHPVQTAAVAYISGRKDLLATFFLLMGLLLYLCFRRETGRYRWIVLSSGAFLLACLSKEVALIFPALVACLELILAEQRGELTSLRDFVGRQWVRLSLFLLAALGLLAYSLYWVPASRAEGFWGGSALTNYGTSFKLFAHYVKQILWPHPLIADYLGNVLPLSTGLLEPATFFSVLLLLGYVLLTIWCWRKAPLLGFGMSWFGVAILPVLQIIPFHELAADHFLYLPAVGFATAAGYGFETLVRSEFRVLGTVLLVVLAGVYSWRTVIRNPVWESPQTLWTATYHDAPNSFRANCNMGSLAHRANDPARALQFLERCLELKPEDPLPYANIGAIKRDLGYQALRQGDLSRAEELEIEALEYLRKAVEMKPEDIWSFSNMGDAYRDLALIYEFRGADEAAKALRTRSFDFFMKALAIPSDHPQLPQIYYKIGAIFVDGEDYAGGIPFLKVAADALSDYGQAQYVLGFCYYMLARQNPRAAADDWEKARKYLEAAMQLQPQPDIVIYLADCYRGLQEPQRALEILEESLRRFPNSPDVHYNLGLLYQSRGQLEPARQHFARVVALDPDGPLAAEARRLIGES